jgi:transcriptional regulator with XRE-family HTH domain
VELGIMSKKTIHAKEYSQIIEVLTSERKRLGLSQIEVATALNMSQSDVSKFETQERRLDILEFKRLIDLYRVGDNVNFCTQIKSFFGLNDYEN